MLRPPLSIVSKCEAGELRMDEVELVEFTWLYGKELNYFIG